MDTRVGGAAVARPPAAAIASESRAQIKRPLRVTGQVRPATIVAGILELQFIVSLAFGAWRAALIAGSRCVITPGTRTTLRTAPRGQRWGRRQRKSVGSHGILPWANEWPAAPEERRG